MSQKTSYRYKVVDVFTQTPLEGNPLAVFPDAAQLPSVTMQRIARELCLPETVFIVPPTRQDCVARLRIFTPAKEMDFAGHPTIGTSFVLLQEGLVPNSLEKFSVEENVGAIPIMVERGESTMLWLTTPRIHEGPKVNVDEAAGLVSLTAADLAGAQPQILSAGNPTLLIAVKSKALVDLALFDSSKWGEIKRRYHPDPICVFVFTPTSEGAYSRMFAPDYGISEDPATGSSTGSLAFYMMQHGMTASRDGARLISEQGVQLGRRSLLHVRVCGERGQDGIHVGGFVTPIIQGEIRI